MSGYHPVVGDYVTLIRGSSSVSGLVINVEERYIALEGIGYYVLASFFVRKCEPPVQPVENGFYIDRSDSAAAIGIRLRSGDQWYYPDWKRADNLDGAVRDKQLLPITLPARRA